MGKQHEDCVHVAEEGKPDMVIGATQRFGKLYHNFYCKKCKVFLEKKEGELVALVPARYFEGNR